MGFRDFLVHFLRGYTEEDMQKEVEEERKIADTLRAGSEQDYMNYLEIQTSLDVTEEQLSRSEARGRADLEEVTGRFERIVKAREALLDKIGADLLAQEQESAGLAEENVRLVKHGRSHVKATMNAAFRFLSEALADGKDLYVTGGGVVVGVSPSLSRRLGYASPSEAIGRYARNLVVGGMTTIGNSTSEIEQCKLIMYSGKEIDASIYATARSEIDEIGSSKVYSPDFDSVLFYEADVTISVGERVKSFVDRKVPKRVQKRNEEGLERAPESTS